MRKPQKLSFMVSLRSSKSTPHRTDTQVGSVTILFDKNILSVMECACLVISSQLSLQSAKARRVMDRSPAGPRVQYTGLARVLTACPSQHSIPPPLFPCATA